MEEERRGRLKGDEWILGKSAFVKEVLRASGEQLHRAYRLRAEDYGLGRLEISQPAVSISVKRGEAIPKAKRVKSLED